MIVQAETEHMQDMGLAKDIGEMLHAAYPGHLWAITVQGGVAVIKDLYISSQWGMVIHYDNLVADAGVRKKKVIAAGGELLERANIARGARKDGERVRHVDGIEKYNPVLM